jgi:hypothetical protein
MEFPETLVLYINTHSYLKSSHDEVVFFDVPNDLTVTKIDQVSFGIPNLTSNLQVRDNLHILQNWNYETDTNCTDLIRELKKVSSRPLVFKGKQAVLGQRSKIRLDKTFEICANQYIKHRHLMYNIFRYGLTDGSLRKLPNKEFSIKDSTISAETNRIFMANMKTVCTCGCSPDLLQIIHNDIRQFVTEGARDDNEPDSSYKPKVRVAEVKGKEELKISLSEICYYLKNKGVNHIIMLDGSCQTFVDTDLQCYVENERHIRKLRRETLNVVGPPLKKQK